MGIELQNSRIDVPHPLTDHGFRHTVDNSPRDEAVPERVQVTVEFKFFQQAFQHSQKSPFRDLPVTLWILGGCWSRDDPFPFSRQFTKRLFRTT